MQLSDVKSWIVEQQPSFIKALEELVNINTFTSNTAGVDQGMNVFGTLAESMGLHVEVIHGRHRLVKAGNGKGKRLLLIAHMDTVHPLDGAFQKYEVQEDGYITGPGIGDIKGGLLMGLWTQLALCNLLDDFDVQLVVSADEEIGSPTIQKWYLENTSEADYALGLEPGFPQGPLTPEVVMGVVKQRKGSGRVTFKLGGKAAHAGGNWEDGLSAIDAMAHRIVKIHALCDPERGITTNVGLIKGGTAANTIADSCEAQVDFRYLTQADGQATLEAIRKIVEEPTTHNSYKDIWERVEDFQLNLFMSPMEHTAESQLLIDVVLEEAGRLDQKVLPIMRGGGSDGNFTCAGGVPSICGMGAPAEGIHTPNERILLPMLWDRLELLISTAYQLSTQPA
jgi:glutamate carboxypeptidase